MSPVAACITDRTQDLIERETSWIGSVSTEYQRTQLLINVMTYPHPSTKYKELVCTAGITRKGEWVRLYPVDYRYRPKRQQFHKYQWIDVDLAPVGSGNDRRKESRKPNLESIRVLAEPLRAGGTWPERRKIIDPLEHRTLNELKLLYETNRTSLGIIRPTRILDLLVEPASEQWKPEWQMLFQQMSLFGEPQKPLRKLPYKFSYLFECEDSNRPHRAMITDWELGVLFLKEADRLGSDEAAAHSVKKKFFDVMCASKRDTRFFMGTVFPYNAWLVIGVFWPEHIHQGNLFS